MISLGFLTIILIGGLILMLPISSAKEPLTAIEAFFTATSASCVTGLVVVDTGTELSVFGQVVVILLIQIGGLGFMTLSTFMFIALGKKASLRSRVTMAESLGEDRLQGIFKLGVNAVKYTFIIEGTGAALLAIRFIPEFGFTKGLLYSLFHSISAFCNAGFDLMGNYASLTRYVADPIVNFTIMALITLGGLGFAVLMDIYNMPWKRTNRRLRMHTRVVLTTSMILLFGGAIVFMLCEYSNPSTFGGLDFWQKLMASLFQSVTCRTAGFNTIDVASLTDASKLFSVLLMFIGGAPAGTAGGIKVTTIAVLILTVRSIMRGKSDTEAYGRRIPAAAHKRALAMLVIGLTLLLTATMIVSLCEADNRMPLIDVLFETTSAIATVGLSAGVSGVSGTLTRLTYIALMYIGRVGLLTMALSLGRREKEQVVRFPEGDIMVG